MEVGHAMEIVLLGDTHLTLSKRGYEFWKGADLE